MDKIISVYHDDSETLQNICRVDFTDRKLGKVKKTDEGYLTGVAPVAKVGILTYFLSDGTTRRELVNEDTLFNLDSMGTLKMKPVTDQHPPERSLDSRTVKRRKVGFTGENIQRSGEYLMVPVTITDHDAVENVDGGRRELSPGYMVDLLLEPGEFNGQRYDAVQLSRRYNHLAVCDRARGGSDLKLQLDAVSHVDGFEIDALGEGVGVGGPRQGVGGTTTCKCPNCGYVTSHGRGTPCAEKSCPKCGTKMTGVNTDGKSSDFKNKRNIINKKGKEGNMSTIRIDGIDYEAAQEVINFLGKETQRADDADKKLTVLQENVDALEGERDGLKTKVTELEKVDHTEKINTGVKERLNILDVARVVMNEDDYKGTNTMTNDEIRRAIIKVKSPDVKLDDRSEEYVNARFDAVVEGINFDDDAIARQRRSTSDRHDSKDDPVEKARLDAEERIRNNYKTFGGREKE